MGAAKRVAAFIIIAIGGACSSEIDAGSVIPDCLVEAVESAVAEKDGLSDSWQTHEIRIWLIGPKDEGRVVGVWHEGTTALGSTVDFEIHESTRENDGAAECSELGVWVRGQVARGPVVDWIAADRLSREVLLEPSLAIAARETHPIVVMVELPGATEVEPRRWILNAESAPAIHQLAALVRGEGSPPAT